MSFDYRKGLCAPSVIAAILVVLGFVQTLLSKKQDSQKSAMESPAVSLVGGLIFVGIIYTLCYYQYDTAAWIVLLLPAILLGALIVMAVGVAL